jgi:hypothetical protein
MPESPLYGPTRKSVGCDEGRFIFPEESRLRTVGEAPFAIQSYGFAELAQMYYPDHQYDSALRHFREEMHLTRGLWEAMRAVGYREKQKLLTRAQVKTIVEFLGEP